MRALTISAHGGTEQLELRTDLPVPDAPPGHVRVKLRAAALNRLDVFTLGGLPGVTITPPWIMGADGTGVIDAIGDGVDTIEVGETVVINPGVSDGTCEFCRVGEHSLCVRFRLLGEHLPGTLAEYVVVPSRNVLAIPDRIPPERAAAYTLATLTAWRMLVTRANVQAGDEVLIWGIGGGVALAALQI
ncbi:MAG TPA: alcohol dehydrogenase catalytic domain-containing protein, partial [Gemmatimonadaceae bacterium]|nr:alcohol dehydrogenase catalytic domain-containing protein [Gemmatimonadaceae bacterium]